jgi:hypothetical protein
VTAKKKHNEYENTLIDRIITREKNEQPDYTRVEINGVPAKSIVELEHDRKWAEMREENAMYKRMSKKGDSAANQWEAMGR